MTLLRFDHMTLSAHVATCSSRIVGGIKRLADGTPDYKEDFFSKPSFLTVSGQLQVGPGTQGAPICACVAWNRRAELWGAVGERHGAGCGFGLLLTPSTTSTLR
jgi:hypothetical protein